MSLIGTRELWAVFHTQPRLTPSGTAHAMECYEKGFLTKEDTGGLELAFGNAGSALKLIEKIASLEGIEKVLADGVKEAAKRIGQGSEKFAVEIMGLEIPRARNSSP